MTERTYEPPTVPQGSKLAEYELAPGVNGYAIELDGLIYIPIIIAQREGSGDVGRFLDSLSERCRIPNVSLAAPDCDAHQTRVVGARRVVGRLYYGCMGTSVTAAERRRRWRRLRAMHGRRRTSFARYARAHMTRAEWLALPRKTRRRIRLSWFWGTLPK